MKNMKKNMRLLAISLAVILLGVSIANVPVYAAEQIQPRAGAETLYKTGTSGNYVGTFYCYNNNLTPVKKMGESGYFSIFGTANKTDHLSGNVVTKIEVREYPSGRVLTSTQSYSISTDGTAHAFETTPVYLNAGQSIQIFFDVCSIGTPPGGYRSAKIVYSYVLQ